MKMKISNLLSMNIYLVLLLSLLLSACNLPFGSAVAPETEVPSLATQELLSTPIQTPEPMIPQNPTIGSTISWFDTSTLVYVPGGEFVMGADEPEKQDFNPAHPVNVNGFWIYSTKVTNEMYNLCVSLGQCTPAVSTSEELGATLSGTSLVSYFTSPEDNGYALKDLPATNVTWGQADNYCKWAGGRLPTEAEWEKTARGEESNIQPWGDDTPSCDLLNFQECGGFLSNVLDYPDGMSDYKALDMAGNAHEWVNDWYAKDYYTKSPSSNPTGPVDGEKRSVRGSSFGSEGELVPSYIRNSLEPDQHRLDVGFRCVVDDPTIFAPICDAPAMIPAGATAPEPGQSIPGGQSQPTSCTPAAWTEVNSSPYCANKSASLGGLIFSALPPSGSWGFISGSYNNKYVTCDWIPTTPKLKESCWGPEGAQVEFTAISSCYIPLSPPEEVSAVCKAGYTLQSNGSCTYIGSSGQAANVSCPGGYSYNLETKCCTQNLPQSGSQPNQFPVCGPGSIFDPQKRVCYTPQQVNLIQNAINDKVTYKLSLGTCDEPKPKDSDKPSQPQPTPTFCDPATGACP
jgi:formylglycine-generating enzyme required for sulfatase activity